MNEPTELSIVSLPIGSYNFMFSQLSESGILKEQMQPITENPAFKTLLQVLENHLNTLPLPLCEKDEHYWNFRQRNQKDVEYEFTSTADIPTDFDYGIVKRSEQLEICDLPYVRERLRLLGLEPHEPLMQTLWLQCNHNLDKMNYRSLWYLRYSDAVKTHTLSTRLLRILNAMMANPPQNLQELGIFSSILKRATPYLTDSHLEQCFPKLSEQGEILCAEATDPKLLYVLGKHLAYFFHHPLASSTNEQQMEAVLTTILDRSLELIDDVTTPNLRNIGQLAKKTGLFYSARRESLGQLAKPFLVDDLTLGRAVDLLFCFDQNFFPGELNEVYNLLDEMLDESKCAMTVTSFLIELAQTKLPASLTEHIHSFIVRNLDDNVNNVSFFQPVLFFVRNYPFEKAEHKDAFHHYLLSVLNTQPQLAMSDLMLQLFRVMVQVCEPHQLTDRLYDVVLKTIDCGKLGNRPDSLFAGLDGLSLLLTERYTLLPANVLSQQLKIKQLLFKELMTRLSDIPEFYMTYYLWPLLSSRALYDTNVINAVLQMYVTYTDVDQLRTMTRFNRIVHLFGKARYFSPEVCDNLTSFVVNHPKKVRLRDANKLVNHLADMSYKPKDFAAFCTLLWDKLDKLDHKYDGNFKRSYEVRILERLSQLQFFPEEMLSRVFSVEYLENLEIELEISYADGTLSNTLEMHIFV